MSLTASLPDRPLAFAETLSRNTTVDLDVVAPLFATIDRSVATSEEEMIVASILLDGNHGALAGFDPTASRWIEVAHVPDSTDYSGVFASLDVLETWLFDQCPADRLVRVDVDLSPGF